MNLICAGGGGDGGSVGRWCCCMGGGVGGGVLGVSNLQEAPGKDGKDVTHLLTWSR